MTHDPREALEPCPFCGGNNVILSHKWDYGFIRRYPYCNGCGARGPSFSGEEESRAWWNTRALTASPGEQKPPPAAGWNENYRTFDTRGSKLTRVGRVLTITCETDEIANRIDDELRREAPASSGVAATIGLKWELSDDTKGDLAAIDANRRNAYLNAGNIVAGSSRPDARRALSLVGDEAKKSEGGKPSSEASSHEKRRLDASDEQTSTGPETSISPVRTIAQSPASAHTANHGVTAGETATPSDPTAERREIVARIIENELSALDLGCGEEVNIRDCIAHFRKEKSLENANDLIGDFSAWCADAILAALDGGKP